MIATTPPPTRRGLVQPRIRRPAAMHLAATEYDRTATTLAGLTPDDWSRSTPCPAWDVRELACHMVGMATMVTTPWETARQQRKAAKDARTAGTDPLTALTALQVSERARWNPERVVEAARKVGPRAARGRRLMPSFIRRRDLGQPQRINGRDEAWSLGYLSDVILTRDPWMHRMDIALATGTTPYLTEDHDGVIVADVVEEWATRHSAPYDLTLTGAAGGRWSRGEGGEVISMDAVDFCRAVSGRGDAPGLLSVQVPF